LKKVYHKCVAQENIHLTHTTMRLGGYDDWTPAEQREWDRDLAELEAPSKEPTEGLCDKSVTKHWLELAVEVPLFKVTCNSVWGSNIYIVEIKQ